MRQREKRRKKKPNEIKVRKKRKQNQQTVNWLLALCQLEVFSSEWRNRRNCYFFKYALTCTHNLTNTHMNKIEIVYSFFFFKFYFECENRARIWWREKRRQRERERWKKIAKPKQIAQQNQHFDCCVDLYVSNPF